MSDLNPATVLAVFVIFCRIGGCLMLMPGFASTRVTMQIRLFVAIAITLALAPLLFDTMKQAVGNAAPAALISLIGSETLTGSLIGLMARVYFLALQFAVSAVANYVGFGALPGVAIDEPEALPPLVSLITMGATVLFFITDQHWEVFRALTSSYAAWPPGQGVNLRSGLVQIGDQLDAAFILTLRISGPFIVYAVIINLAVGLVNRLVPQIPVYFISLPFTIAGGLILLYFAASDFLRLFITGFASWLEGG